MAASDLGLANRNLDYDPAHPPDGHTVLAVYEATTRRDHA